MRASENPDESVGPDSQPDIAALAERVWTRAKGSQDPESVGRDEFPVYADD